MCSAQKWESAVWFCPVLFDSVLWRISRGLLYVVWRRSNAPKYSAREGPGGLIQTEDHTHLNQRYRRILDMQRHLAARTSALSNHVTSEAPEHTSPPAASPGGCWGAADPSLHGQTWAGLNGEGPAPIQQQWVPRKEEEKSPPFPRGWHRCILRGRWPHTGQADPPFL